MGVDNRFKPGVSGNPKGRPKKASLQAEQDQIRALALEFLKGKLEGAQLEDIYNELSANQKAQLLINLHKLTIPAPEDPLAFRRLTEEDLDSIIERLEQRLAAV